MIIIVAGHNVEPLVRQCTKPDSRGKDFYWVEYEKPSRDKLVAAGVSPDQIGDLHKFRHSWSQNAKAIAMHYTTFIGTGWAEACNKDPVLYFLYDEPIPRQCEKIIFSRDPWHVLSLQIERLEQLGMRHEVSFLAGLQIKDPLVLVRLLTQATNNGACIDTLDEADQTLMTLPSDAPGVVIFDALPLLPRRLARAALEHDLGRPLSELECREVCPSPLRLLSKLQTFCKQAHD